jgi:hypothetical protein
VGARTRRRTTKPLGYGGKVEDDRRDDRVAEGSDSAAGGAHAHRTPARATHEEQPVIMPEEEACSRRVVGDSISISDRAKIKEITIKKSAASRVAPPGARSIVPSSLLSRYFLPVSHGQRTDQWRETEQDPEGGRGMTCRRRWDGPGSRHRGLRRTLAERTGPGLP